MNVNSSAKHLSTVFRVGVVLALSLALFFMQSSTTLAEYTPVSNAYSGIPTTAIKSVDPGVSVTVTMYNFPADEDFTVYMGPFGTRGIGGYVVGSFYSAGGGSFELTFDIAAALVDDNMIAIRMQTANGYYYAYDWFYNQPDVNAGYVGYPTTTIVSIVEKTSVEVKVFNLPEDVDFDVTIGEFGTRGVGGVKVADFNSGTGGTQTFTFDVPASLAENYKLAVRIDSGVYYAFDWWVNNSAAEPSSTPSSTWNKIPTTSFVSLNSDGTVTFMAYNFEPDTSWQVTMGAFGTRGVDGTFVQTFTSVDGTFTVTSEIPPGLAGLDKIAIRYEQVDGPYYAYDWFNNQ